MDAINETCTTHKAQSPSFRQPHVLLESKLHELSEIGSFASKYGFDGKPTWIPAESLVCDVSRQLNVLHQVASCPSRYDIRDITIHIYPKCTTHKAQSLLGRNPRGSHALLRLRSLARSRLAQNSGRLPVRHQDEISLVNNLDQTANHDPVLAKCRLPMAL
ncbi:hypothetical protein T265_06927 [Opisthorchis viverrini]|uniref:Uncharacterized protein n=1 Tax=Opisthorchis viverrini TaxID=6198 RepID=A0A074ZED9_OPIVI|nr:hypothetical protein T265_06927 [Opisthorchis viverrini]KER25636.1 hypothetical protein T265_06927 [Opisthorchis viverrini]